MVQFKPEVTLQTIASVNTTIGAELLHSYVNVPNLVLVRVSPDRLAAAITEFIGRSEVLYVHPDYELELYHPINDPDFSKQWGLQNLGQLVNSNDGLRQADVRAQQAWDEWDGTGNAVRIAVIDIGVDYTHPDLCKQVNAQGHCADGNIWKNPNETPGDADSNGCPGICGFDDDGDGQTDELPPTPWPTGTKGSGMTMRMGISTIYTGTIFTTTTRTPNLR